MKNVTDYRGNLSGSKKLISTFAESLTISRHTLGFEPSKFPVPFSRFAVTDYENDVTLQWPILKEDVDSGIHIIYIYWTANKWEYTS
jgi:hypothetical protein